MKAPFQVLLCIALHQAMSAEFTGNILPEIETSVPRDTDGHRVYHEVTGYKVPQTVTSLDSEGSGDLSSHTHADGNIHDKTANKDELFTYTTKENLRVYASFKTNLVNKSVDDTTSPQADTTDVWSAASNPHENLRMNAVSSSSSTVDEVDIFNEDVQLPIFQLYFDDCLQGKTVELSGTRGVLHGFMVNSSLTTSDGNLVCEWTINVPVGMSISADVHLIPGKASKFGAKGYIRSSSFADLYFDAKRMHLAPFSSHNQLNFTMNIDNIINFDPTTQGIPGIHLRFQATAESLQNRLRLAYDSPTTGYIVPFGFDRSRYLAARPNGIYSRLLQIPKKYFLMVSFSHLGLLYNLDSLMESNVCGYGNFDLLSIEDNGDATLVFRKCFDEDIPAEVYDSSLELRYVYESCYICTGFKMLFSFHPELDAPIKLQNGLFNCSMPHYARFKHHLHCNLQPECQDGEDEGEHCPFSPPGCNGLVGHKNKCYKLVVPSKPVSRKKAEVRCRGEGGDLAMMKTDEEWQSFRNIFHYGKIVTPTLIGLKRVKNPVPGIYKNVLMWNDGTLFLKKDTVHLTPFNDLEKAETEEAFYYDFRPQVKTFTTALSNNLKAFACQLMIQINETISFQSVHFPKAENESRKLMNFSHSFFECPSGHVTHDFLSCDPLTHCWTEIYVTSCPTTDKRTLDGDTQGSNLANLEISLFVCDNDRTLHYTLVCDFRDDCGDGSDEQFCVHGTKCPDFKCRSGQCVYKHCNSFWECFDGSDEEECIYSRPQTNVGIGHMLPQLSIPPDYYDRYSNIDCKEIPVCLLYLQQIIHPDYRLKSSYSFSSCPQTHLSCPGELEFCLPVYVRCNGVYDCPGKEDEAECQSYTCPGFYRCRASSVCVHLDHLCDGFPHCPQHDDELLCDFTCPHGCRCQGLAFVCHRFFAADTYPALRYLDASYSGMSPDNLTDNVYLMWLSLTSCGLETFRETNIANLQYLQLSDNLISSVDTLKKMNLTNLRILDLSYNYITCVNLDFLNAFPNIEILILADNPLVFVSSNHTNQNLRLRTIDLSSTYLRTFDSYVFSSYPQLSFLNLSFTRLQSISVDGFQYTPELTEIDMRGLYLSQYPAFLFTGLSKLRVVYAESYKLCCDNMLPSHLALAEESYCFSPDDPVSSCDHIVNSDTLRLFLWACCLLSIIGNVSCLIMEAVFQTSSVITCRLLTKAPATDGIGVLIINLCVANLLMGIYLAFVTLADHTYSGIYAWHEEGWSRSAACTTAGYLWLLSRLVSATIICLITLDRYLVVTHRPQFHSLFQSRFAWLGCGVTWAIGLLLVALPLFAWTSHGQFYGQTGLCFPMFLVGFSSYGQRYFIVLIVVFNIVLCLPLLLGQCIIYRSVRVDMTTLELTPPSPDITVSRRLVPIAILDVLCYLPFGLVTTMVYAGLLIESDGSHMLTALYLLPFNTAVSPLIYLFSVVADKRRLKERERLLMLLKARLTSTKSSNRQSAVKTKTEPVNSECRQRV